MPSVTDRALPCNLEAEKSVLGAILINNHAFGQAAEIIDADDFFRDAHQRIFAKMLLLTDRNDPVDLVTLKDELTKSSELEDVGGPAYISALTDGVPRSANIEHYARIVKEKSTLRRLIHSASDAIRSAYDGDLVGGQDALSDAIDGISDGRVDAGTLVTDDVAILDEVDLLMQIPGHLPAIGSGALFGASGCGKTGVATMLGLSLAARKPDFYGLPINPEAAGPVLYIATEGGAGLKARILTAKTELAIPYDEQVGLYIYREPFRMLARSDQRRIDALVDKLGTRTVIIDHLTGALAGEKSQNDDTTMAAAVDVQNRLAAKHNIFVMVVHHSRNDGERERGSGALRAGLDVMWEVKRADNRVTVSCSKMRDCEEFSPFDLDFVTIPGYPSYALRSAGPVPVRCDLADLTPKTRAALDVLQRTFGRDGASFAEWQQAAVVSERSLYSIFPRLIEAGFIRRDGKRFIASEAVK